MSSSAAVGQSAAALSGFRVLRGPDAAVFRVPADVRLVSAWRDELHGITYERYQQFKQPFGAHVEGAQLTVVSRAREQVLVIGAHYPSLVPTNRLLLDADQAIERARAAGVVPALPEAARAALQNRAELRIDPVRGRLIQRVESFAEGVHVFARVDAETGVVIDAWDALAHESGAGTGVHGDRKSLLGANSSDTSDDLTRAVNGAWIMKTVDSRISTYDARRDNRYYSGISVMADNQKAAWANDNDWRAKYQRPAVDAQYYSDLTNDWYRDPANVGGYDFLDTPCEATSGGAASPIGPIRNVVHFDAYPGDGYGYDNAFWDGAMGGYVVYGDGDGVHTGPFSGSQDVVSHELTHAVTQCRTLGLAQNYYGQPGALNEALSDIMATAMEWSFDEPPTANCRRQPGQARCADWWIGEDVMLRGDFGFRHLADPDSAGQPGHWQDRCNPTTCYDNGGVHINSTIPSHAFYLAVNGGRNARCSGPNDPQNDCGVVVPAIGLTDATQIFFGGWAALTENATFCEAHDATVATAEVLFPGSNLHRVAIDLAWTAVGRGSESCGTTGGLSVAPKALALAAGSSGGLTITASGSPTLSVGGPAGASFDVTPTASGAAVQVTLAAGVADGVYPLKVTADYGVSVRQASAVLIVDSTAPVVSVHSVSFAPVGHVTTSGQVQLVVEWSASDEQSGLASSQLQSKATDAVEFSTSASGQGPSTVLAGAPGYSFRIAAEDSVGNAVTSEPAGPWLIGRHQEDAASYKGSWSGATGTAHWGSVRYSTVKNASLNFNFTGTDVAWISTKGPKRGKAKVYVDNVLVQKVDLWASSLASRRVAFVASGLTPGAHKLTIVVVGTSGRPRIDVDGFVTLSQ